MFQTNTVDGEGEYAGQAAHSVLRYSSHLLSTIRAEASGPAGDASIASSTPQKNHCAYPHGQDAVVERLRAFLSSRVSERVTLKELSRFLGYSEKYASDVFQRYMGRPFSKHLKQLRLDKATSMLLEERHTITKIAESVGFSDAFAFSHFFKRAIGCSPSEYRKQQLRQADMA